MLVWQCSEGWILLDEDTLAAQEDPMQLAPRRIVLNPETVVYRSSEQEATLHSSTLKAARVRPGEHLQRNRKWRSVPKGTSLHLATRTPEQPHKPRKQPEPQPEPELQPELQPEPQPEPEPEPQPEP
eukprot:SAG31_NODE_8706_length_1402_cov_1.288565_1_plen_126_part_01